MLDPDSEPPKGWNEAVLWHKQRRKEAETQADKLPAANKYRKSDCTAIFTLFGGPYHGVSIRTAYPFQPVTLEGATYRYHKPVQEGGTHKYMYEP